MKCVGFQPRRPRPARRGCDRCTVGLASLSSAPLSSPGWARACGALSSAVCSGACTPSHFWRRGYPKQCLQLTAGDISQAGSAGKGCLKGQQGLRAWWGGQRSKWKLIKTALQTLRPPSLCPVTAHSCQESSWPPAAHPDPGR